MTIAVIVVLSLVGMVLLVINRMGWLPQHRPPPGSSVLRRFWPVIALAVWYVVLVVVVIALHSSGKIPNR